MRWEALRRRREEEEEEGGRMGAVQKREPTHRRVVGKINVVLVLLWFIIVEGPSKKGVNFGGEKNLILTFSEPQPTPWISTWILHPGPWILHFGTAFWTRAPIREFLFYTWFQDKKKIHGKIHTKIHRLSKAGEFPWFVVVATGKSTVWRCARIFSKFKKTHIQNSP